MSKNRILRGITSIAIIVMLIAICFVDSKVNAPAIVALVLSLVWLGVFTAANGN